MASLSLRDLELAVIHTWTRPHVDIPSNANPLTSTPNPWKDALTLCELLCKGEYLSALSLPYANPLLSLTAANARGTSLTLSLFCFYFNLFNLLWLRRRKHLLSFFLTLF